MLLYIVRHGDPVYVTDSLTERGKRQAEAVGKRIYDSQIDRIFSSPMGRALETAEPACRLLGLECNIEEWTHEIGDERLTPFPDGKLKSITNVQNTYYLENGSIDLNYNEAFTCTGINESNIKSAVDFIEKHGNEFLERLGYKKENGVYKILRNNEEKVALFCHSAFARAWLSVLLHIPFHIMWSSFSYTHTGVTVLEFKNNPNGITAPRCLCFSDMSHLYAQNEDMIYDNKTEL
ncbi:MAG: histidine phosphatase family protein [Acutalibacteraceae bacterium]|nr:histidine phosphatase family protein [Acutalibacteraceae bacterium]